MTAHELSLKLTIYADHKSRIYNSRVLGLITGKDEESQIVLSIYAFTESGSQLIKAVQPQTNQQYILDCLRMIDEKYENIDIAAYDINYIEENGNINYIDIDILSSR